jgi:UDP-3-O-[3-hydroxymyristoyl] glucosamine N-acyltransferase
MDPKYAADLPKGKARCAMLWPGADWQGMGLQAALVAPRPRYALSELSATVDRGQGYASGIHETAVIDATAQIGANATIGPLSVIGASVIIGNDAVIGPQCTIGTGSVIGHKVYLREGVRIGADVIIGDNFIAQPGATVGADGFPLSQKRSLPLKLRVTVWEPQISKARAKNGRGSIPWRALSSAMVWNWAHSVVWIVVQSNPQKSATASKQITCHKSVITL